MLSRLQHDGLERENLEIYLRRMNQKGVWLTYSDIHVAEIEQSQRPAEFIEILERINARFLQISPLNPTLAKLEAGRLRDRIAIVPDAEARIAKLQNHMVSVSQFVQGGLSDLAPEELVRDLVAEIRETFDLVRKETPELDKYFSDVTDQAEQIFRNIPLEKYRDEHDQWLKTFKAKLPNFAQIDELPPDAAIQALFGSLDDDMGAIALQMFPKDFLKDGGNQPGVLTGFGFMLFGLGLVRDRRTQKGAKAKQRRHYLGQLRDCMHIERAAFCDCFVTMDDRAARLAQAVYGHAGCATRVVSPNFPPTA